MDIVNNVCTTVQNPVVETEYRDECRVQVSHKSMVRKSKAVYDNSALPLL